MFSNIIESGAKSLAKISSNKKFCKPFNFCTENKDYLLDLSVLELVQKGTVFLPKKILPNDISWSVFNFTYQKDPLMLPILLRYFTHKNLLQEAKDDLNRINRKLQSEMNNDLKKLRDEQKQLENELAKLLDKEMNAKHAKVLATNSNTIAKIAPRIEEIELCKGNIKELFSNEKATGSTFSEEEKYYFMLKDELTKMMEKELKAYVKGNKDDVEKTYQNLNSKAKKIIILHHLKKCLRVCLLGFFLFSILFVMSVIVSFLTPVLVEYTAVISFMLFNFCLPILLMLPILLPVVITLLVVVGVIHLVNRHYEQSFVKEMEDFIKGSKYVDKTTNTENIEELKQEEKEQMVEDLIDLSYNNDECEDQITPSAPTLEEVVKGSFLYPSLERYLPSSPNIME
ncbi:MAG: hypothetical protein AB3P11_03315 [Wolbachia pipientis]